MRRRLAMLFAISLEVMCIGICGAQRVAVSALDAGFESPPQSAHTFVWWHWINGNVSREGIVADLEDMKRAGVAGVQLIDVAMYSPPGPVRYHSEEWYSDVHFAMVTAHRLGLVFGVANGPGWSGSGGPWVTPELAMKRVVWTETNVRGGPVLVKLQQPTTRLNFYRDIAVVAVPADAPEVAPDSIEISPLDFFERGTNAEKSFAADDKASVTLRFQQPVERRTLEIHCARRGCSGSFNFVLEASADGRTFSPIRTSNLHGEQTDPVLVVTFPPTTAVAFRIRVSSALTKIPQLTAFTFSDKDRVEDFRSKELDGTIVPVLLASGSSAVDALAIQQDKVIDVTSSMSAQGVLAWEAPPGAWTILRIGYTSTGATVHPPQPEGEGLEIDKMSAAATDLHFERSLGRLIREAGPLAGATFKQVMVDSWESGQQNWTANYPQDFARLRGYDIAPYLPILTGRVVESTAVSEAFLRDFRRTISELVTENYYGEFRRLAHQHGLDLYAEAYPGAMFNETEAAAQADTPMTEFWAPGPLGYNGSVKLVASAVHTSGKGIVAAESFTGAAESAGWLWTPATLKPIGDSAFASGMNQSFLHAYVHQPRSDVRPGWTMGRYGTQFGRLELWWQQGKPWLDYMARCQFLLQQGHSVSDVLVLRTEEIDGLRNVAAPNLPRGVDFDWVDSGDLLRARITGKGIALPHAGSYQVLWLPDVWTADLPLLQQVERAVRSGLIVFGGRPVAAASPGGVRDVGPWQRLVDMLWPLQASGPDRDAGEIVHAISTPPRLLSERLAADLVLTMRDGTPTPLWTHRHTTEGEIYFIANVGAARATMVAHFPGSTKRPELWDAVTGAHGNAQPFSLTATGVEMPLELEPGSSIFVVFRSAMPGLWLQSVVAEASPTGNSQPAQSGLGGFRLAQPGVYTLLWSNGKRQIEPIALPGVVDLVSGWSVQFLPPGKAPFVRQFDALHDLARDRDPAVHFFSGTATYVKRIQLSREQVKGHGCLLQLGDVQNIASVRVNGKFAAVLWSTPYSIDISHLVHAGENVVEVSVIDRWVNRMIGDEQFPPDAHYVMEGSEFNRGRLSELPSWYGDPTKTAQRERTTFASWQHFTRDSPLVPAGLLGPVRLSFSEDISTPNGP